MTRVNFKAWHEERKRDSCPDFMTAMKYEYKTQES